MVKINLKHGNDSHFLYVCPAVTTVPQLLDDVCAIYNGRLKVGRLCGEVEQLAEHGLTLPPNMQGLTDEQVTELKLTDEWGERCVPSGGYVECHDPIGRRNGRAPTDKMADVLRRTSTEAKALISKDLVDRDVAMTQAKVQEALDMLSGAVTIVYPMGTPPYEPITMELKNEEDLSGTHAGQEVIPLSDAALWFCGKSFQPEKTLADYVGRNEKTKAVLKLTRREAGAPSREPAMKETEQRALMAHWHQKQEESKRLAEDEALGYADQPWADTRQLRRQFHGISDIKWGPR